MREIKFRGKRLDNGQWLYGYFSEVYCTGNTQITTDENEDYQVILETVGQYTGVHDINGKEIYEGDIIQYEDINKGVVEYSEKYAQFILKETGNIADEYEALGEFNIKVFEVIGNIHDNKDLLESED